MSSQQTPGQTQGGVSAALSLENVLKYIFSREGLEQNLDISLNLSQEGQLNFQLLVSNANISKTAKNVQELVQVGQPSPRPSKGSSRSN